LDNTGFPAPIIGCFNCTVDLFCGLFAGVRRAGGGGREHLTYAMSINAYSRQKLEHLQLDHKEK
jgi:hypothetical protein